MPAEMLTKKEHREPQPAGAPREEQQGSSAAVRTQAGRARRLKLNVAAWGLGTILVTAVWVLAEWRSNGAFQSFGHEGNPGEWNPTLWAVIVGLWGLAVGILALRVYLEQPTTSADVDRAVGRITRRITGTPTTTDDELRRGVRGRLEAVRRLKFHVAAWVLGMIVLTPLNVLIEWQDNGGFQRFSSNNRPGSWDPWVLRICAIWALGIAALALWVYFTRPKPRFSQGE